MKPEAQVCAKCTGDGIREDFPQEGTFGQGFAGRVGVCNTANGKALAGSNDPLDFPQSGRVVVEQMVVAQPR